MSYEKHTALSEKKELYSNPAVRELIETEQTYNKSLKTLNEVLQNQDLYPNSNLLAAFRVPVEGLMQISTELLKNAKKGIEMELSAHERNQLKQQREQYLKIFFTTINEQYGPLYKRYTAIKDASEFQKIDSFLRSMPEKLGLDCYLITPMQRSTRYLLLVKEIEKQKIALDASNLNECKEIKILANRELESIDKSVQEKEYEFGDYTKSFFNNVSKTIESKVKDQENREKAGEGYQFGDLTLKFFGSLIKKDPSPNNHSPGPK